MLVLQLFCLFLIIGCFLNAFSKAKESESQKALRESKEAKEKTSSAISRLIAKEQEEIDKQKVKVVDPNLSIETLVNESRRQRGVVFTPRDN